MSWLWEISTDSVVTVLIVVCISALAIAWLLAGRRRPAKRGSLEQRRLAGREAEVYVEPFAPAIEMPSPDPTPVAASVNAEAPQKAADHQPKAEAETPLPLEKPLKPSPASSTLAKPAQTQPRSTQQANAMSITAALVRHDKRQPSPDAPPAHQPLRKAVSTGGDDLTAIDGIDAEMAKELNDLGIRYFDQIITWSPDHAAWITSRLSASVTVAQRNAWMAEAKALAEQPAERAG